MNWIIFLICLPICFIILKAVMGLIIKNQLALSDDETDALVRLDKCMPENNKLDTRKLKIAALVVKLLPPRQLRSIINDIEDADKVVGVYLDLFKFTYKFKTIPEVARDIQVFVTRLSKAPTTDINQTFISLGLESEADRYEKGNWIGINEELNCLIRYTPDLGSYLIQFVGLTEGLMIRVHPDKKPVVVLSEAGAYGIAIESYLTAIAMYEPDPFKDLRSKAG